MLIKRLGFGFTIMVLVLSACGKSPAETQAPPVVDTSTQASPAATQTSAPQPTATPEITPPNPGEPLDPLALYRYQVATGQWSEGQGVKNLLDVYIGDADPASLPYASDLTPVELTSLIRLADFYLENGADDGAKADIEQMLLPFNIPDSALQQYSEPDPQSNSQSGQHLAMLNQPRPPAQASTCVGLYVQGFPAGDATLCFRYRAIHDRGVTYSVYYPATWSDAHPQWGKLAVIRDAVNQSVTTYNAYGPAPIMTASIVIAALPGRNASGNFSSNIFAKAVRDPEAGTTACRVGVFSAGLGLTDAELQQSIAHEMFHCYQYTNLSRQESGPSPEVNQWWVEGSAVFFSDVAYPNAGEEENRAPNVTSSARSGKALYEWSYEAFSFFEYLNNHAGWRPNQIISFLASMPTSGGYHQQALAISAAPGMHDAFQGFAQKLVDGEIQEMGGSPLATQYDPRNPAVVFEGENGAHTFSVIPLTIGFYAILLPQDRSYTFTMGLAGPEGRSAVRPGSSGTWGRLPPSMILGCGQMPMQLVMTTLYSNENTPHQLTISYVTVAAEGTCNTCLEGKWSMDLTSYLQLLRALSRGEIEGARNVYYNISGQAVMEFQADGTMINTMQGLRTESILFLDTRGVPVNGPGVENMRNFTATVLNGTYRGTYSANDTVLSYNTRGNMDVKFYFNGQLMVNGVPGLTPPGGDSTIASKYICTESMLLLAPNAAQLAVNANAPWLTFYKIQP